MNSYKVKGIILAVIISLASIMMPFSVYADTISNSNVNINYYLESVTEVSTGSYLQTYKVDFIFDQSYLGWISTKMVGTFVNNNTVPVTTSQFTYTRSIYVNGSIASTTISFTTPNTISNGALQSLSQSIQNSNVSPLADLSSLQDIIDLLQDIDDHISINVLDELQNIVSNTSLANDYLEKISILRNYNFPIESFSAISYLFNTYEIVDYFNYGSWSYPLFKVPANSSIGQIYYNNNNFNTDRYLIIIGNFHANSNPFTFNNGQYINYISISTYNTIYGIWKITFKGNNTGSGYTNITTNRELLLCPVYLGLSTSNNFSNDFALQFGLSNELLDNIRIIANGTTQSNSAASDLESEASEYSEIADDVIGVEEGLTSNFETEVNKIDLDTGLNVFGGNFMTSATWVRTQFDRLTENTPYGSLVVYGLTLGFALLMLGKVFL